MPSFDHDSLVDLVRERPDLGNELLRVCLGVELEGETFELGSIDLSLVTPAEYRADAVIIARDGERRETAGLIIEIQLRIDNEKRFSWPVYITALRSSQRCPVWLVVVVPDESVARWARQTIDLGHPGFRLRPAVIRFDDVPRITDAAHAAAAPQLTVLSAVAHGDDEVVARTALDLIAGSTRAGPSYTSIPSWQRSPSA